MLNKKTTNNSTKIGKIYFMVHFNSEALIRIFELQMIYNFVKIQ